MIEALKDDSIVHKLGGRFKLTALIQKRMVELMQGARPLVERGNMTDLEVVIQEILQDKITINWAESGMTPPQQLQGPAGAKRKAGTSA
ncbi:MAG: DNA-directed RNA polymerase subunit omega [Tepidisphaerales bacterium]